jgi:predicted DNA-binding transcriptional regulator AlpA
MMKRPVVASKDKLTHRLTPAAVRWALAEIDAGQAVSRVALSLDVSRQILYRYMAQRRAGTFPSKQGRPRKEIS